MITLYQFQFSHFCEKARWALDHKRLPYRIENLLPGLHLKTIRKLAPLRTVPVIRDDATVVQDSTAIIDYLDTAYPDRLLTPTDPSLAAEARAREAELAEQIGIPLRLWLFHHLLDDQAAALQVMLNSAKSGEGFLFKRMFPKVREQMRLSMDINEASAVNARETFCAALDKLDTLAVTGPYLVGDHFSRADLSASALLSPFCAPNLNDEQVAALFPPAICELRHEHKDRPYFSWVRTIYREHRQGKAEADQ